MTRSVYPSYKVSGVEWLGEIPEHWQARRIGHTTYVKGRIGWQGLTSDEFIDEGPYCLTGTDFIDGKINWSTCYRVAEERYQEDPYIHLKEHDLLITKDGTIGKTAIVLGLNGKATLNSGIFLTRPIKQAYNTSFMYWVLNSRVFGDFIDMTKMGSTISHLYQNVFVRFSFPLPSLHEQQVIASFLDRETARIDELVAKKQLQIELLHEKRSALISRAVTKGLDPNVKLKGSGVEWLGEIPEQWSVYRLRMLLKDFEGMKIGPFGSALKLEYMQDNGYKVYGQEHLINVDFSLGYKYIDEAKFNELIMCEILPGDLVVSMMGTTGKCQVVPESIERGIMDSHLLRLRPNDLIFPSYLAFLINNSDYIRYQITTNSKGSIMEGLNSFIIKELLVMLPSLAEQRLIAAFLDRETARIDELITQINTSIDLLRKYRTALISAAVTGRIDVREEVA